MPKVTVFSCPSCGASLSVDNEHDALVQCQFCGNTVIVPEELRSQRPRPGAPAAPAQVVAPGGFNLGNLPGMDGLMAQANSLRDLGNLVRAGQRSEAVQLYHQTFGGSLTDAQAAIDALAAGQPVQVSSTSFGAPVRIQAGPQAPQQPYVVTSAPVQVAQPRRGSVGCALFGFLLSLGIAAAAIAVVTTGILSPDIFTSLLSGGGLPGGFTRQVMSFGGEGTGAGVFTDPRSIGVDGEGNIYVGEYQNPRIQVFDSSGKFITQWQVGNRQSILVGMAVDRQGVLYAVHESLLHRYDGMTGELLGTVDYEGGWGFDSVVTTPDGGLVVSHYKGDDDILRFDRNGNLVLHIANAISGVSGDSELDTTVAVDGQGNIFALGSFNNAVFRYSSEGQYINRFGGAGDEPGQFRAPSAIAVDNQSRVYVSDIRGIQVFDSDGRYLTRFDPPGHTFGMVFDDQNALYVIGNNGMVYKYTVSEP